MSIPRRIMTSRSCGFVLIAFLYILAAILGCFVFLTITSLSIPLRVLAADSAAMVFIYIGSLLFKNASLYDPYWSIAPIVILTGLTLYVGSVNRTSLLLLTAIWIWGVRLTTNWAISFSNLKAQDWRYDQIQAKFPRLWPAVSFFGIQLMPTFIVFLNILPGILLILHPASPTAFTYLCFPLCLFAPALQGISDKQLRVFRRKSPGQVCNVGLWKLSRHPNYLGEILMWWGVWLMLFSVTPAFWWTVAGALINQGLFLLVSVPMMEKRELKNKPDYVLYCQQTGKLLPHF